MGYWWWAIASDGFNLKKWLVESFPVSISVLSESQKNQLAYLGKELNLELKKNYVYKDNKGRIGNYFLPACKEIIEEIDDVISWDTAILSREFWA